MAKVHRFGVRGWVAGVTAVAAGLSLSGCVVAVGNNSPASLSPAAANTKLAGMQYLYGSVEADAISRQAWNALVSYACLLYTSPSPRDS